MWPSTTGWTRLLSAWCSQDHLTSVQHVIVIHHASPLWFPSDLTMHLVEKLFQLQTQSMLILD